MGTGFGALIVSPSKKSITAGPFVGIGTVQFVKIFSLEALTLWPSYSKSKVSTLQTFVVTHLTSPGDVTSTELVESRIEILTSRFVITSIQFLVDDFDKHFK